jgi:hypothetical protein
MVLGRMNMASPNVLQVRGEKMPRFSTFEFDICGPSYLRPIRRAGNGKLDPGFLVADIVLGRSLDEDEVRPFIRKVQTLSYLRGVSHDCMAPIRTPSVIRRARMPARPAGLRSEAPVAMHVPTPSTSVSPRSLTEISRSRTLALAICPF